jgi:hypothetical protein
LAREDRIVNGVMGQRGRRLIFPRSQALLDVQHPRHCQRQCKVTTHKPRMCPNRRMFRYNRSKGVVGMGIRKHLRIPMPPHSPISRATLMRLTRHLQPFRLSNH